MPPKCIGDDGGRASRISLTTTNASELARTMAEPGKKTKDYSKEAKEAISEAWDTAKVTMSLRQERNVVTNP